jgi:hypothetical protein
MIKKILGAILLPLFFSAGCSTAPATATNTVQTFELTLKGELDGQAFQGIALGSTGSSHDIKISSRNDINYFIAKTCHRSDKKEDVITQGWIKETQSWSYDFEEAPTLEDTGDCPLRICEYSKTVGAPPVQCAVIDFLNSKYSLPAENICNGADGITHGKNICHTQTGLVERIRFKEPVIIADPLPTPQGGDSTQIYLIQDQCAGKFIDPNQTVWQYVMPQKECYVVFDTLAKPHRRAKLTVIPYNIPLYSGGN